MLEEISISFTLFIYSKACTLRSVYYCKRFTIPAQHGRFMIHLARTQKKKTYTKLFYSLMCLSTPYFTLELISCSNWYPSRTYWFQHCPVWTWTIPLTTVCCKNYEAEIPIRTDYRQVTRYYTRYITLQRIYNVP